MTCNEAYREARTRDHLARARLDRPGADRDGHSAIPPSGPVRAVAQGRTVKTLAPDHWIGAERDGTGQVFDDGRSPLAQHADADG